jgi:pyridoxamine 5'-phosphate oxidase
MPSNELLPESLPTDPMALFASWFADAARLRTQPNPDAMVLATADEKGRPAARVVLCKQLAAAPGYAVFFTNYQSRKGRELSQRSRAAGVFHWDALHRQVRIEGAVLSSPASESDEYFARRPLESRISAWASQQSEPLASRAQLAEQVRAVRERLSVPANAESADVPRPPHWGGYRLWIDTIELWVEGPGRIHDRAMWQRTLEPADEFTCKAGPWRSTRLNP